MNVEWKNKPVMAFKDIKVGECFSLQYAEDNIRVYLKIPIKKVLYKLTTGGIMEGESNAVNVKSGNLVRMTDNEEVQFFKATLMIET